MLNEFQVKRVWENMLAAETRALYFGDLTSRSTRLKQWIVGLSFLTSSSAAASIIAKLPNWLPLILAFLGAAATAYSMAVNLDARVATMAKLHAAWGQIATRYDRLWNHTADADAEQQLDAIMQMEKEPSELAATDAPNNQKLMEKWQNRVFALYHLPTQA